MKGDFTGFSFNGIHSSQLNIVRVSSSDRYDEELFSEIKDKTIEIPNNNGNYYYGSSYGTRTFEINIAFDSVTETQFRQIRRLFSTSKICDLIFDERPYKVYSAKIESPIELSYVCFDEPFKQPFSKVYPNEPLPDGIEVAERIIEPVQVPATDIEGNSILDGNDEPILERVEQTTIIRKKIDPWIINSEKKQRIYKGEGTISLICYFPFAHQLYKVLNLYSNPAFDPQDNSHIYNGNTITTYDNVDEWKDSSGILDYNTRHQNLIDEVNVLDNNVYKYAINVYNPGDLDVGFCLYIPFTFKEEDNKVVSKICPADGKNVIIINGDDNVLYLTEITRQNDLDTGILINTTNHLIEGVIYNHVTQMYDSRKPSWITTGTIYNQYIVAGDFPHILKKDWNSIIDYKQSIYIDCAEIEGDNIDIYYNYLYF